MPFTFRHFFGEDMRLFLCKDTEISVKMSVFVRDYDFYIKKIVSILDKPFFVQTR